MCHPESTAPSLGLTGSWAPVSCSRLSCRLETKGASCNYQQVKNVVAVTNKVNAEPSPPTAGRGTFWGSCVLLWRLNDEKGPFRHAGCKHYYACDHRAPTPRKPFHDPLLGLPWAVVGVDAPLHHGHHQHGTQHDKRDGFDRPESRVCEVPRRAQRHESRNEYAKTVKIDAPAIGETRLQVKDNSGASASETQNDANHVCTHAQLRSLL
mmetsp:Transcript_35793/g.72953  ORF Transcript_35793/g.72953 Transcript_35793/m.72953 type:complete len:209 (+) Transcript_35793:213-839(+)